MKLSIEKNILLNGVSTVSKAVSNKTTLSILDCILLSANNNQLTLTANNTELGIESILECDVIENGIIAINSKIFSDIVRKLPDGIVNINCSDDYIVNIVCGKVKFKISGKSGDEFVMLPEINREDYIEIPQIVLKNAIDKTIFSISNNDINKTLTGELFEIKNDILRICSLDGHRMSIRNIELNKNYNDKSVIVPGKTLIEVSKIITGSEDNINIYFMDKHIVF